MTQHQKQRLQTAFQLAVRLSRADYDRIQQIVKAGLYRNSADFLREAVHEKLESMDVMSVRDVDEREAGQMIEDYLIKHPGPNFASEIADALGLNYDLTFKTVKKLLGENRIKKAQA